MADFRLKHLKLAGFKSIGQIEQSILFSDDVTILLGPNGAGKSNIISFFQMLNFMMTGALREFVARQGYAHSLLHYGPDRTTRLTAELLFSGQADETDENLENYYRLSLSYAAGDILIFTDENIEYRRTTD
ncbi:MAG: AAA family ATPase, partial [Caldilineaceae bacterium]|nr:AAA family ATPase [Caldilineaceae bacterium]